MRHLNNMGCICCEMNIQFAFLEIDNIFLIYGLENLTYIIIQIRSYIYSISNSYSVSILSTEFSKIPYVQKIRDNSQFSLHNQFLRSFGLDCLDKIKKIQLKLNKMDWDTDKCKFQDVVPKVKSILDAYQIIAYQIFDSCESAQLEDLAHSILKMFLQISSATKWLIKSFSTSIGKNVKIVEKMEEEQNVNRESQAQRFRKKQISRFILREFKQKLYTQSNQQNDDSWDQNSNSLFGSNKQKFQNSKNKLLSITPSNAPMILQDTVQSFTKKSEYIDKFIALRQNYEGSFRYQQPLTSQAIIEEQMIARNNLAAQKFKQFCDKLMNFQISKKVLKFQYGIQVTPVISASQKMKKAAQKNKIKILMEDLQRQKQINKQLKLQIDIYQKKLSLSLKQNEQLQIIKKKAALSSSKYNIRRPERQHIKTQDHQEQIISQHGLMQDLKSSNNLDTQQKIRRKHINVLRKTASAKQLKFGSQTSMKYVVDSDKSTQQLRFDAQVFNIQIDSKVKTFKKIVTQRSIPKTHAMQHKQFKVFKQIQNLGLQSCVYTLQISTSSNTKVYDITNKFHFQSQLAKGVNKVLNNQGQSKLIQFNNVKRNITPELNSNFSSTPISTIGEVFPNDFVTRRNRQLTAKSKQRNGIYVNKRMNSKNLSMQCFLFQNKLMKFHDPLNVKVPFQTLYKSKQIKSIQLTQETICHFFIDENNARNYQLLNVSELCNVYKRIKMPNRRTKASTEIGNLSLSSSLSSAGFKKIRSSNAQNQNMAQNILAKKIYMQFVNTKKLNKQTYLKLILFIRYPHSSVFRSDQILKRANQSQQNLIDLAQIQSHLKRIWSIHSRCNMTNDGENNKKWCQHKKYIVQFFGFEPIQPIQQIPNTSNAVVNIS